MVDCAGLENRRAARFRGFESHLLRHKSAQRILKSEGGMRTQFDRRAAPDLEGQRPRLTQISNSSTLQNHGAETIFTTNSASHESASLWEST